MSELERRLAALAADVDWPETPPLELRLEPAPPARPRRRRGLVVGIAVALIAIGVAFAVPPARSAILDFFRLGGVTVERVDTLPEAEQRALGAGLGEELSPVAAEAVLGAPLPLPDGQTGVPLYQRDGVVSAVLASPEPVLLSAFRPEFGGTMTKKISTFPHVEQARIDPDTDALWIGGGRHVVYFFFEPSPRLAGNVLVWERDGITYRLEGRTLTKARALELARQLS